MMQVAGRALARGLKPLTRKARVEIEDGVMNSLMHVHMAKPRVHAKLGSRKRMVPFSAEFFMQDGLGERSILVNLRGLWDRLKGQLASTRLQASNFQLLGVKLKP